MLDLSAWISAFMTMPTHEWGSASGYLSHKVKHISIIPEDPYPYTDKIAPLAYISSSNLT